MELIFITGDPRRAEIANSVGVDRVLVDLELHGKVERQGHRDTQISDGDIADIARVGAQLTTAKLMVRVDAPSAPGQVHQIEASVAASARTIMLPMFRTTEEVGEFVDRVGGRARTCLLVETKEALAAVEEVASMDGVDEIHVGLNDLHMALGHSFMFQLLVDGTVERVARAARAHRLPFGVGGVARLSGTAVVSAELILAEHVRLGSTQVILSRDFQQALGPQCEGRSEFRMAVAAIRRTLAALGSESESALRERTQELRRAVDAVARG